MNKIRLTFTSGVQPAVQEFETELDPVEFLSAKFGTPVAFANMGGQMEVSKVEVEVAATPKKGKKGDAA